MYKRKIEDCLVRWKENPHHKPIIIKGVRQCGKTSSVKAFAQANYAHVVYLDFRAHPEYKQFFQPNLDVNEIIMRISATLPSQVIEPSNTCFVFDEVQDCPMARASLKYFCLDGRYDVLCTGSLLGVNGYKTKEEQKEEDEASIPVGFENIVNMYPMDFEEWLWANGIREEHIDILRKHFQAETPVDEAIHMRFRQLLLQYVFVGGMPEAVSTFLTSQQVGPLLEVQRQIIDSYEADMIKYARTEDKPRIRECFESIPKQLAKENKKFTYTVVRSNGRGKDYAGSLQWIEDAGIIRRCYNTTITELPLDGNSIRDQFKVYMADTGLFVSMLEEGTASSIIQGQLGAYKGAIYENLIADIFGKMGRKLYYFHKDSGLEIDFLMRYKGECVLVECKARTGNAKSLQTVLKHPEKYHVNQAIKLGDYNVGRNENVLTIPLYMAFLLTDI
ncbi:MAG: ATP-binding protein [Paludibacteraceae bacterium]|nr:ATP-binding protein [Paludibacteraceae bacterium]